MLDYSFHCIKIHSPSKGYYCACNFDDLPQSATDKQLASVRRKVSFLGLRATAAIQEHELEITSASLLGAALAKYFVHGSLPAAELSNILGPDVPVQSPIHTSPHFLMRPSHLSQEGRSWELLRLIGLTATAFHLADAETSADNTYDEYIALPGVGGNLLPKVYDKDAPRSTPPTIRQEREGMPEGTH